MSDEKLSDLIEQGSKTFALARCMYYGQENGKDVACPLGMAWYAAHGSFAGLSSNASGAAASKAFRELGIELGEPVYDPMDETGRALGQTIRGLVDYHEWSLEQVLDWLRAQEL